MATNDLVTLAARNLPSTDAGTFDVAVVSGSTALTESGLPDLGGLDVDQALLAHVGRQVSHRDPHGWQPSWKR